MFISDLAGIPVVDADNASYYAHRVENGVSTSGYMARPKDAPLARCAIQFPKSLYIDVKVRKEMAEEQERKGTRLVDLMKPHKIWLHQGSTNSCATADTEVLTECGWTLWPDYNGKDLLGTMNTASGMLEFQEPLLREILEHDGEVVYSTNKRMDFGVTPDHRMLVRKWDERNRTLSNDFTFQRAGELGWYVGLPHATKGFVGTYLEKVAIEGDRQYDGNDFLALISLIISDGYTGASESTRNWVSFCCFHEGRYNMVAALAARIGFKEKPSRRGVWGRYDAGALANWCRANCYTGSTYSALYKRVPEIVKVASQHQIEHFLRFFGDQSHVGQKSFCSTSKRMIDDLQELLLRVGKRGTIWKAQSPGTAELNGRKIESHHPVYSLGVSETDRLCLERKHHIETDHYKGLVYCATVPNGTLITRRNGSILISGNCWSFAVAHAAMTSILTSGEKPISLNPTFIANIVNDYRDRGGWGDNAIEAGAEHGWPSLEEMPELNIFGNAARFAVERARQFALKRLVTEWYFFGDDWEAKASMVVRRFGCYTGHSRIGHEIMTCGLGLDKNGDELMLDCDSYGNGYPDLVWRTRRFGPGEDQGCARVINVVA